MSQDRPSIPHPSFPVFAGPAIRLRQARPCDACGLPTIRRPGESDSLTAYRVTVDTMLLDQGALRSMAGLAAILGAQLDAPILAAMAPDDEIYKCASREEMVVCFWCYADGAGLAALLEAVRARRQ